MVQSIPLNLTQKGLRLANSTQVLPHRENPEKQLKQIPEVML
jgi:hypothetical protein